jgi:hypothetical protein
LFGHPTQHTNVLLSYLPLWLRDVIATTTVGWFVGDLSRWGIQRPKVGPNHMIEESGRILILDLGTIAMVKKGKIRVLPALQEILPDAQGDRNRGSPGCAIHSAHRRFLIF